MDLPAARWPARRSASAAPLLGGCLPAQLVLLPGVPSLATLRGMFGIVLFVVVVLGAMFACVTLITVRRVYGQIGRGRLSINEDLGRSEPVQHDDEIRQMLQARNERRQRRG